MKRSFSKIKSIYANHGWPGIFNSIRANLQKLHLTQIRLRMANFYEPSANDLQKFSETIPTFLYKPVISIILPVYNPELEHLKEAVNSVINQVYPNWELCIADDNSSQSGVKEYLEQLGKSDTRIKLILRNENGHISACSNSALTLAKGEFVALLDHDDTLAAQALFEVVKFLNINPKIDLIYSNEDKLNRAGKRCEPTFKADWSPDYFLSMMYIGHLSVYRKSLVDQVKGFRVGFEGSQDYDLALRITELTDNISHLPKILYHWRKHADSTAVNPESKPYAFVAGKRALTEALARRECSASIQDGKALGIYRTVFTRPDNFTFHVITFDDQQNCKQNIERANIDSGSGSFALIKTSAVKIQNICSIEEVVASEVGRPGLGLLCGKIVCGRKIIAAGARLESGKLYPNFHGSSKHSHGYAARLVVHHNVNFVWPMAFIVKTDLLNKALKQCPDDCSFATLTVNLCIILQSLGLRHVYSPYLEFETTNNNVNSFDLTSEQRQFEALKTYKFDLFKYVDKMCPAETDNAHLMFAVNL